MRVIYSEDLKAACFHEERETTLTNPVPNDELATHVNEKVFTKILVKNQCRQFRPHDEDEVGIGTPCLHNTRWAMLTHQSRKLRRLTTFTLLARYFEGWFQFLYLWGNGRFLVTDCAAAGDHDTRRDRAGTQSSTQTHQRWLISKFVYTTRTTKTHIHPISMMGTLWKKTPHVRVYTGRSGPSQTLALCSYGPVGTILQDSAKK